jgi:hypothetical protein
MNENSQMNDGQKSITVTLSRAHKIADRLKGLVSAAAAQAREGLSVVNVNGFAGDQQVERFAERRSASIVAIARFDELNCALTGVRSAIGRANVAAGVSDLLANQEGLKRRFALLKEFAKEAGANELQPEQLKEYRPLAPKERGFAVDSGVSVSPVTPAQRLEFEATTARIQKELFALSDKLADLNAYKITIAVPESVANELGL